MKKGKDLESILWSKKRKENTVKPEEDERVNKPESEPDSFELVPLP